MATNAIAFDSASGSLKCKTWVLKVSIHCEGCKREVKKALQKLEGVYKISVDSQQHKVTVTGNINSETLLNKLSRIGKHAEVFPENTPEKPKQEKAEKQILGQRVQTGELVNKNGNGGQKNTQVNSTPTQTPDTSRKTATNSAKNSNSGGKAVSKTSNPGGKAVAKNSNTGGKAVAKNSKTGDKVDAKNDKESSVESGGDKNRGKGQKGNFQKKGNAATLQLTDGIDNEDLGPQGNQSQITIPNATVEESVLSQEIILSYNSTHHSSGKMHDLYHQYIPPQPSVYTDADQLKSVHEQLVQEQGQEQRGSNLHSFDMFSEENANGCSIM